MSCSHALDKIILDCAKTFLVYHLRGAAFWHQSSPTTLPFVRLRLLSSVFQTPYNLYGKVHLQHQDDDAIWYGSIEYTPYMGTQNEQTHCQATACTGVLNTAMLLIQAMGRAGSKGRNTFGPWSSNRNQLASDRLVLEWGDPRSPVRVVMGEAWMLIIARLSMSQTCLRTQFFSSGSFGHHWALPRPKKLLHVAPTITTKLTAFMTCSHTMWNKGHSVWPSALVGIAVAETGQGSAEFCHFRSLMVVWNQRWRSTSGLWPEAVNWFWFSHVVLNSENLPP